MTVTNITIDIISDFEGFKANLYLDAEGIPTIGYGHTEAMHDGELPAWCNKQQAVRWLREDIAETEKAVLGMVNVPLTPNQFGALVSLCFNIGQGNLKKDSIITKLNGYDYLGAVNDFWMWRRDKSPSEGGIILEGLQERRSAERDYFLNDNYDGRISEVYKPSGSKFYHDENHPSNRS